jgi:hypothetical protein
MSEVQRCYMSGSTSSVGCSIRAVVLLVHDIHIIHIILLSRKEVTKIESSALG